MRISSLKRLIACSCLAASWPTLAATGPQSQTQTQPPASQSLQLDVEFASGSVDYKTNTGIFKQAHLKRGDVTLQADEAVGTAVIDFNDSTWTFRGHVIITTANGNLRAERANVKFLQNRIVTATIYGAAEGEAGGGPATFEQRLENPDTLARGRASTIEYDVAAEKVRLQGDVWINDGRSDITGQTLVYSIREQKVLADPDEQGKQRVHITINPDALKNDKTKKPPQ